MKIPTVEKCCCCTLRTGSLILAWLTAVGSALGIISSIILITQLNDQIDKDESPYHLTPYIKAARIFVIFQLVLMVIAFPIGVLLIVGINKAIAKYFVPYLVLTAIFSGFSILSTVAKIIQNTITVPELFINILSLAISVYFAVVVYSYYKVVQQETTNNGVAYQQPPEAGYPLAPGAGDYNQPGYPMAAPGLNNQAGYPLAASPGGKIQPAPNDGLKPNY